MNTAGHSSVRFLIAAGLATLLITVVFATVLLLPDRGLARADEPSWTERGFSSQGPVPVPALSPPIRTPQPGQAVTVATAGVMDADVEVIRFRPKERLVRGQAAAPSQGSDKPAGQGNGDLEKPADTESSGPREAYSAPDYAQLLAPMDWVPLLYEGFVGFSPPGVGPDSPFAPTFGDSFWTVYDFGPDNLERTWGATDWKYYFHDDDPSDTQSAWPAAFGADALDPHEYFYSDNLNSWLDYGPMDLSNMEDVFVSFGLWYETELGFDNIKFCASTDGLNYLCDTWSGISGGWTDQAYWLTSYAGYSEVWVAWVFQSDASNVDDGPFVDEILVQGHEIGGEPTPTPTPDPNGELVQNGSFEDSLTDWLTASSSSLASMPRKTRLETGESTEGESERPSPRRVSKLVEALSPSEVGVSNENQFDRDYAAYLRRLGGLGVDSLYQTINVPTNVTDLVINYWFGVETDETQVGYDWFCASVSDPADHGVILVDLGCIDATDAAASWEETVYWQETIYTLNATELTAVSGRSVDLVFNLFSDVDFYGYGVAGSGATTSWVDYVRVYATGSGVAASIDPNEPNDEPTSATSITCGETITGVIGDALGGYDIDWFQLTATVGRIDVDIDADTQVPPSALDSIVGLWDNNVDLVTYNDDDGVSFDSYVVYTNTVDDATFYISVESFWGSGSADSFYDLTVECAGSGSGPPPPGNEQLPENRAAWTVMLYLNAEDPGFESILTRYRTDIEAFIGSKDFLNVVILYDGPGDNGTTRYLVQPNGAYTDGANRWHLAELNMGHPDTLSNFVSWAMDQYPADHYYLAVDDHGDGAYGISWDPTSSNDQLTPPELYSALKSATRNGARKIDIFDYEACLMGLAENAYDLTEWVDYVVFFQQISWGINTYPEYFRDLVETDTALAVGPRIIDRYYETAYVANGDRGYPHTISLIDTSKMGDVREAASSLGSALQATGNQTAVRNARNQSQAFAADIDATNPIRAEYIDLWDLADKASGLAASQAAAVKSAIDAAVVHERHASGNVSGYTWNHDDAHGLSIYYPVSTSSSAFSRYGSAYRMSQDGTWDEFLSWAVPTGIGRGLSAFRSELKLTTEDAYIFKDFYIRLPLILREQDPPPPPVLSPIADATVLQGHPSTNFGDTSDMWVGYDHCPDTNGQISRSLIQFDLSGIPARTSIARATLSLYLVNSCDIGERTHTATVYRINAPWPFSSVTWNSQPGYAEAYGAASIPSRTWGRYTFDVTDLVRGWVNGNFPNYGLMIRGPESSGNDSARLGFSTIDTSYSDQLPYISVTYSGAATQEGSTALTAGLSSESTGKRAISDVLRSLLRWPAEHKGDNRWVPAAADQ